MIEKVNILCNEIRLMGINFYIPLITFTFFIIYFSNRDVSFIMFQIILTPLSGWWIIWSLEHNVKRVEYKLISTILVDPQTFFTKKCLIVLLSYSSLTAITLVITYYKSEWMPMLLLIFSQIIFFTSLAYLVVIVTREASASIALIYMCVLLELFPIIKVPFWPSVFVFNQNYLTLHESASKFSLAVLYSIIFFYTGNKYLSIRGTR